LKILIKVVAVVVQVAQVLVLQTVVKTIEVLLEAIRLQVALAEQAIS
jgi:hypothetical protein